MDIESFVTDAHWPRECAHSQFRREDRLNLCYQIWTPQQPPSTVPTDEQLTIVFVTGAQMTKEAWHYHLELLVRALPGRVRNAIALDCAPQGESAKLNRNKLLWYQSWADYGRDINIVVGEALKAHKFDGPAILFGHSMGGGAAMFAANFCPAMYAGLCLFDAVWSGIDDTDVEPYNMVISKLSHSVYRKIKDKFASKQEWDDYEHRTVTASFHPRVRAAIEPMLVEPDAATAGPRNQHLRAIVPAALQAGQYLSSISTAWAGPTMFKYTPIPAVVVRGDIEDWNPYGSNEELAETLPDSQLLIIPGGGHNIIFQLPDECVAAVAPLLDQFRQREVAYRQTWRGYAPHTDSEIEKLQRQSFEEVYFTMQTGARPAIRNGPKPKL